MDGEGFRQYIRVRNEGGESGIGVLGFVEGGALPK